MTETPTQDRQQSRAASASGQESRLLTGLAASLRTSLLYEPGNQAMLSSVGNVHELLASRLSEQGKSTISVHNRCFFVDSVRVRMTASDFHRLAYLMQVFAQWHIGALDFCAGVDESELARAAHVIAAEPTPDPVTLAERLAENDVTHIHVVAESDHHVTDDEAADLAVAAYATCMEAARETSSAIGAGDSLRLRRLRHVTQSVVDRVLRDPASMVSLTTIKEYDTYLLAHSTNVAILSVILGQRLGLAKARLGELCLAAFLHDIGKVRVDPSIVRKEGPLTGDEWEIMLRHPLLSADVLLTREGITPSIMLAVTVAFEHHLNYDLTGYPPHTSVDRVGLEAGIVSIADRYDAMTTPRPYREHNITPAEALHHMISGAGTHYDPLLLKLFVEMMGAYPVGTVVRLNTNEVCVVHQPPLPAEPLDRPVVRVIEGSHTGVHYNLAEKSPGGGFARSVRQILNPANQGMLPAVDPERLRIH